MTDLVTKSSIQETTSSIGPGTLDLDGSATGWNRFRTFFADNDYLVYARRNASGSKQQLIRGQLKYGTGAGGRDQLTVVNVLASTDGAGTPTAIDWISGDNPSAVFCCPAEDLLDSAVRNHYGTTRPVWLKKGFWVAAGAGPTARLLYWFDGTDNILFATIDETNNDFLFADPTKDGHAANKNYTDDNDYATPRCRLTLATGTAIPTADQTAKTTLYLTPHQGRRLPIPYGAGVWVKWELSADLSLALDPTSGHTDYHQNGKNYDCWVWDNAGTLRLGTNQAWTNDTTRADALALDCGRWVNNGSINLRYGSNSGDRVTGVAAKTALYVGTIRCTADGQVEDSLPKRFVWNTYNRVPRAMRVFDTANTWSYSTGSFRQANNSAANQLDFVRGLDEDAVLAMSYAIASSSAGVQAVRSGIGLDSTATPTGIIGSAAVSSSGALAILGNYVGFPGLGRHFLAWLEKGAGADTQTWFGDNGSTDIQTGITGMVMA